MVAHSSESPEWAYLQLQELIETDWLLAGLRTAVKLNLPEAVPAQGQVEVDEIARKTSTLPAMVYRLLRAMAAHGFMEEHAGRRFSHTQKSRLLRKDTPRSVAPMFEMQELGHHDAALKAMPQTLQDGVNGFHHAQGEHMYAFLAKNSAASDAFNRAMVTASTQDIPWVLHTYKDFAKATRILDVGGGLGHFLVAVLKAHPHLQGAVFDLPSQSQAAQSYFTQSGAGERAQFVGGSFFESLPKGYDLYMIKSALWNWGDDDNVRILGNMRAGIAQTGGRVLIVERLITPQTARSTTLFDIGMMTLTQGGRCRTADEYTHLANQAGLTLRRSFISQGSSILEFAAQ